MHDCPVKVALNATRDKFAKLKISVHRFILNIVSANLNMNKLKIRDVFYFQNIKRVIKSRAVFYSSTYLYFILQS